MSTLAEPHVAPQEVFPAWFLLERIADQEKKYWQ
jgi:hypothetical protein